MISCHRLPQLRDVMSGLQRLVPIEQNSGAEADGGETFTNNSRETPKFEVAQRKDGVGSKTKFSELLLRTPLPRKIRKTTLILF